MSKYNYPRLTKSQADDLKADIKILSGAICKQISNKKSAKIPVTSAQNAIARHLGFTSFSGLTIDIVPTVHHADFSLYNAITPEEAFECYSKLKCSDAAAKPITEFVVKTALEDLKNHYLAPNEATISLADLHVILNRDKYCLKDDYKTEDGLPREFVVSPKAEFFKGLESWDQFRVYDGDQYKCFTIEEFEHIYDKVPCFKVVVGRWYENGLCIGDQ
jgi:hypothetical protein